MVNETGERTSRRHYNGRKYVIRIYIYVTVDGDV